MVSQFPGWRCDYSPPEVTWWGGYSPPWGPMSGGDEGGGGVITYPSEVPCLEGMGVVEVWLLTPLRSHVWRGWGWWRCDYSPLWGHMSWGGEDDGGVITHPSEVTCLEGMGWWRCDYSPLWGPMSGGDRGGGGVITHLSEVPCLEGMEVVEVWLLTPLRSHVWWR